MTNITLLQKVHDYIKRFPQSVDMDVWYRQDNDIKRNALSPDVWDGLSSCIGGLSIHLSGGTIYRGEERHRNISVVRARLGLSDEETRELLFFDHDETTGLYTKWRDDLLRSNKGTPEYAEVVCQVLRSCIKRHSETQLEKVEIPPVHVRVKMATIDRRHSSRWMFWKRKRKTDPAQETVEV